MDDYHRRNPGIGRQGAVAWGGPSHSQETVRVLPCQVEQSGEGGGIQNEFPSNLHISKNTDTHMAPEGGMSQLAGSVLAWRLGPYTATMGAQGSPGMDNRPSLVLEHEEVPKG